MLGESRRTEPIRCEVCPRAGGEIRYTDPCEMNDAKPFSLGEGQFLEFAFSLIALRLAVGRTGQLIMGMNRAGGPLA